MLISLPHHHSSLLALTSPVCFPRKRFPFLTLKKHSSCIFKFSATESVTISEALSREFNIGKRDYPSLKWNREFYREHCMCRAAIQEITITFFYFLGYLESMILFSPHNKAMNLCVENIRWIRHDKHPLNKTKTSFGRSIMFCRQSGSHTQLVPSLY